MIRNLYRSTIQFSKKRSIYARTFATFDDAIPIPMPALSPTMTHGNLAKWNLGIGDKIDAGVIMCEVETDKATVDYEAQEEGYLAKIVVQDGETNIEVGTTIGFYVEELDEVEAISKLEYTAETTASTAQVTEEPVATPSTSVPGANGNGVEKRASPAARHLLDRYNVSSSQVQGTGKHGIITKADALKAVKGLPLPEPTPVVVAPPTASVATPATPVANPLNSGTGGSTFATTPAPQGDYVDHEITQVRRVIATRLAQSKREVPHFYSSISCNIDKVLEMRKSLKSQLGNAPSVNDVIIKACALALRDVPEVNQRYENGKVTANESIDVSVAVATPSGLITPIVKHADAKGLLDITSDMKDLAARARENKLKLEEFQGGSFTVSNLGMFGIDNFTAVINPPQAAIMAIGGGKPVARLPVDAEELNEEEVEFDTMMTVAVSCDRRVIDEATAARYLQCFRNYMENPLFLTI